METKQLINNVIAAIENMAAVSRYTPLGSWYKGDHGKARTQLLKALRALLKATKEDSTLQTLVKEYTAGVRAKDTGSSIFSDLQARIAE